MPRAFVLLLLALVALGGCATTASDALALEEDSSALREMQSRRFLTRDEAMVLQASAALLQDLGFSLDDSESEVGLIVASKERSAVEVGQVMAAVAATVVITVIYVVLVALSGSSGGGHADTTVPWDDKQHMRVCLVTRPVADGVTVRVTFQRIVWDNEGRLSKREPMQHPSHYVEFFERLSKALFLEAYEL